MPNHPNRNQMTIDLPSVKAAEAYDLPISHCFDMAIKINARRPHKVRPADYVSWMTGEGSGDIKRFDRAAKAIMGDQLFDCADGLARLENVLWAVLEGKKSCIIGGITFKNLQKR